MQVFLARSSVRVMSTVFRNWTAFVARRQRLRCRLMAVIYAASCAKLRQALVLWWHAVEWDRAEEARKHAAAAADVATQEEEAAPIFVVSQTPSPQAEKRQLLRKVKRKKVARKRMEMGVAGELYYDLQLSGGSGDWFEGFVNREHR